MSNHQQKPIIPYIGQILIILGMVLFFGSVFSLIGVYFISFITAIDDPMALATSIDRQAEMPYVFFFLRAMEAIGGFIIPAVIFPFIVGRRWGSYYNLKSHMPLTLILLVIAIAYFVTPAVSLSGKLNQAIELPQFLSGFEQWLQEKSDQVQRVYAVLLNIDSPTKFIVILFVVAVIPAIGEELVFRGAIQNIFYGWTRNAHWGIWIAAFIFSALHLQFYLFLPRFLLGALFGYMVFWSGNLWYPILAHFLNNAMAVSLAYYYNIIGREIDLEEIGEVSLTFSLVFTLILFGLLYLFRKESLKTKESEEYSEQTE